MLESRRRFLGEVIGLFLGVGPELDQQPAAPAFGKQGQIVGVQSLLVHVADQPVVDAFQTDRVLGHDFGNRIAGFVDVGITQHQQRPLGRMMDQPHFGFEQQGTSAFGSDQRAGDVKAIFGQQFIETITGDPPGNVGKPLADGIGIMIPEPAKFGINLRLRAAGADDAFVVFIRGLGEVQLLAFIGHDVHFVQVIDAAAGHHGMHAAGVVPQHPAEGAVVVRGRIRPPGQIVGHRSAR